MHNPSLNLVSVPALAFALGLGGVPLVRPLARRLGATAMPVAASRGLRPTALLGGVAIIGAFLVALALTGNLPWWILFSTAAMTAIGLIDDIFALRPLQKLLEQIAVTIGVIVAGPRC